MIIIEEPVCRTRDCNDECLSFNCKVVSGETSGCWCENDDDDFITREDKDFRKCLCCKICKYTHGYRLDWWYNRQMKMCVCSSVSFSNGDKIDSCYSCHASLYYVYSRDGIVYRCVSNKELHDIVPGLIHETIENECLAFVSRLFSE
jgi:hypothetical protein